MSLPMSQAALWEHALEAPDELDRWLVLGDWLQSVGDPRGVLVALQAALESERSPEREEAERRFRFEHRHALLGPLAEHSRLWLASWRAGFVSELELVVDPYTTEAARILSHLARDGGLWALRSLRLVSSANFDAVVTELLRHRWPLLARLELGPLLLGAGRLDVPLADLFGALPALRTLRVEAPASLEGLSHARLESLAVSAEADVLSELDLAGIPSLRRLELYSRGEVPPRALRGVCGRALDELSLHTHVARGWLAAPGPLPRTLVLHERSAEPASRAQALGCEIRFASSPDPSRDRLLTPSAQTEVRRFEKGDRFWQIHRDRATVHFGHGRIGARGTHKQTVHHSPYTASQDYVARLEKKLAEGYREVWLDASDRTP